MLVWCRRRTRQNEPEVFLLGRCEQSAAAAASVLALYPLSRWRRYGEPISGIPERPAMTERPAGARVEQAPVMSRSMAFLAYVVLTVVTSSAVLITPVHDLLSEWQLGLSFPAVTTGFGIDHGAVDRYAPIRPLSHPGAKLLITALIVWIVYRAAGYYRARGQRETPPRIGSALLIDAVPASLPVIAFLVTSRTLDHSGQILTIAHGIADVSHRWSTRHRQHDRCARRVHDLQQHRIQCPVRRSPGGGRARARLRTETIIAAQAAGSTYGNAIAPRAAA